MTATVGQGGSTARRTGVVSAPVWIDPGSSYSCACCRRSLLTVQMTLTMPLNGGSRFLQDLVPDSSTFSEGIVTHVNLGKMHYPLGLLFQRS